MHVSYGFMLRGNKVRTLTAVFPVTGAQLAPFSHVSSVVTLKNTFHDLSP